MADTSFPARMTVKREPDVDGLPVLTAQITVTGDDAKKILPPGPAGVQGQRGRPRTTFRKMGEIPNVGARPAGLGPEDRGKWWHRLDDNGMDVWTGVGWQHSPQAVGPRGSFAKPNSITVVEAVNKPEVTNAAVEFIGKGSDQQLKVTVPAGLQGPKGPAGASGNISESGDFDTATGPTAGSVFAYHRASRKFRVMPTPMGIGPWSWYQEDFSENQQGNVGQYTVGTFTIPAQQFAWRPIVHGHLYVYSNLGAGAQATVRLQSSTGEVLAAAREAGGLRYVELVPSYREGQATKSLSPTSTFATVPAGEPATLVVLVTRVRADATEIGFNRLQASLVVNAQPI